MTKMQIPIFIVILILLGCMVENTEPEPEPLPFNSAITAGEISDNSLSEASGLIASRVNKGMFWVINDSDNDPKIFLIDDKGVTIHAYWLVGAVNTDWEDLAIGKHNDGKYYLYIGDVGDNAGVRNYVNLLVLEEPSFKNPNDTIIESYKKYALKYPDNPKDSETVMIDPISSTAYIVSKRESSVLLYEVPDTMSESDTTVLKFRTELPFFNVTAGDVSSNGQEILLKTYDAIYYWKRENGEDIVDAMTRSSISLTYSPEPQGESIAWAIHKDGFYTLSEKSWAPLQVLYFYERN